MKRKITYLIIITALVIGAFFIGKSAQLNHSSRHRMNSSIPMKSLENRAASVG